jgi:hypothetical protein
MRSQMLVCWKGVRLGVMCVHRESKGGNKGGIEGGWSWTLWETQRLGMGATSYP